ncbi:MAG TPA: MFS transporter [Nitrososphaerales archaeon]|nr:MFS transporter [Nitrososphaerales archaeon]
MEYKWVVLSNTTLGTLMSSLDGNIVLIALPTIARDLPGTSVFDLLWLLLGYQLLTASVLVNFGRLADMFGRVKLYNFGFVMFTLGSALCSFSQSSIQLILFRLVQGIGASFLFSNSAAIITDAFPENQRGMALGVNQVSIVIGSVGGLVLGGFLTSVTGWRSIFWVNIPIGIFATVWSRYKLRELAHIRKGQKLDVVGNISFAGGLALVLAGITLFSISYLSLPGLLASMAAGAALLVLFVFVELRTAEPMFNLSLFKIRMFSAGNIAILLNALARGAVSLVLVFYLQGPTMGLDPLTAGLYLLPISLSLAALGPVSGWLSDRHGARLMSTLGLVVSSAGFLLLTGIGPTITFQQLLVPLVLVGAGMGLFASPNRASIMNSLPQDQRGVGSGISTTLVVVGGTVSLAIAFLVMVTGTPIAELQQLFLGTSGIGTPPWIGSFIQSIRSVYFLSTIFLILAIIPSVMRGRVPSADPS